MPAKKQHYVPQFLLRRFATKESGRSRISVYDIDRIQYRSNQNIRDVCAGNYVYDTDASFEQFLSEHIETPASVDIERLAQAHEPVNPKPTAELLRFLLVQLFRTRQSYENGLAFMGAGMQTMFAELARLNGYDVEAARRLRISHSEPRAVLAYLAAGAAINWRLISDLRVALVVNRTATEFILSDHPVFQHNWYLRDSREFGASSITARGVQFFLPISPSVTCCLYDPTVYLYREASAGKIVNASEEDVCTLNAFQAINAGGLLMARASSMQGTLQALGRRYADARAFTETAMHTPATIRADGTLRSLHVTERRQERLPAMPSFVKVKNKVRKQLIRCVERNPEFVRTHEAAVELMRVRHSLD